MNDIDILKLYFKGDELQKAIKKYENGTPAAYIIGEWEFFGDRYLLNEDCLIPRCDTERVVEKVLDKLSDDGRLLDLCTGSGCIAVSTLKRKPNASGVAVDIDGDGGLIVRQDGGGTVTLSGGEITLRLRDQEGDIHEKR